MKHIIGIDFGTSTTMIKTREFDPANDTDLECRPITFTQNGVASCPTLIRKLGDSTLYGEDALTGAEPGSELLSNFKLLLNSPNPEQAEKAEKLTKEFFVYLYKHYEDQKSFVFKEKNPSDVTTRVSYPAQWGEKQRRIMTEAAKEAGFPNVEGVDEATAAVCCVLKTKQEMLESKGFLKYGKPLNILIIDMGAGTTDLAFAEVTVGADGIATKIKGVWPKSGSKHLFGGYMIDRRLEQMLSGWLRESKLSENIIENIIKGQSPQIKAWKETTVSAHLKSGTTVESCSTVANVFMYMGCTPAPFVPIDCAGFETIMKNELTEFVNIINTAPKELRDETELVILTGGNSVWYWIDEIISGRNTRFGSVGLKNISGDSSRILRMNDIQGGGGPADTVSKGLVLGSEMKIAMPAPEPKPVAKPTPAPDTAPRKEERPTSKPAPEPRQEERPAPKPAPEPRREEKPAYSGTDNTFPLKYDPTNPLRPVLVSKLFTAIVNRNGTVTVTAEGKQKYPEVLAEVAEWKQIVSVSTINHIIAGLTKDGKVFATSGMIDHSYKDWKNIVSICIAPYFHTVRKLIGSKRETVHMLLGLDADGKLHCASNNRVIVSNVISEMDKYKKVDMIKTTGGCELYVVSNKRDIAKYFLGDALERKSFHSEVPVRDISDGAYVGTDGKVRLFGKYLNVIKHTDMQTVESWKDVISVISSEGEYIVALKSDNTISSVGFVIDDKKLINKDIIALSKKPGGIDVLKRSGKIIPIRDMLDFVRGMDF